MNKKTLSNEISLTYPDHFEITCFRYVSGPDQSLATFVLQLPSVITVQVNFQNVKVIVVSYTDFTNFHFCFNYFATLICSIKFFNTITALKISNVLITVAVFL